MVDRHAEEVDDRAETLFSADDRQMEGRDHPALGQGRDIDVLDIQCCVDDEYCKQLSAQLDRRRESGFDDITTLFLCGSIAIPQFLRRNDYIEQFGNVPLYPSEMPSLSEILLKDWDGSETGLVMSDLIGLHLPFTFGESPSPDAEQDLEAVIRRRSSLSPFARLSSMTLWFNQGRERHSDDRVRAASVASFNQIAKGLIQIGGTDFQLISRRTQAMPSRRIDIMK